MAYLDKKKQKKYLEIHSNLQQPKNYPTTQNLENFTQNTKISIKQDPKTPSEGSSI